jgi:hypothetical protein
MDILSGWFNWSLARFWKRVTDNSSYQDCTWIYCPDCIWIYLDLMYCSPQDGDVMWCQQLLSRSWSICGMWYTPTFKRQPCAFFPKEYILRSIQGTPTFLPLYKVSRKRAISKHLFRIKMEHLSNWGKTPPVPLVGNYWDPTENMCFNELVQKRSFPLNLRSKKRNKKLMRVRFPNSALLLDSILKPGS